MIFTTLFIKGDAGKLSVDYLVLLIPSCPWQSYVLPADYGAPFSEIVLRIE